MKRQNVTLSLPKTLLQKARVLAAKEEKSLSELLRECLEERVRKAIGYEQARRRQLKFLHQGFDLGTNGHLSFSRNEIHRR